MFVKPAPGRVIRWPRTYVPLADAGENVPDDDLYWQRAVNQGDLVLADDPAAGGKKSKPQSQTSDEGKPA